MARIELTLKMLVIHVTGADRLFALKSQLEVPLAHVTAVEADPEIAKAWWKGWQAPGIDLPGVITAGTFYRDGKRTFWDVQDPERTVVIHLAEDQYDALVVGVEEPKATAEAIARAASAGRLASTELIGPGRERRGGLRAGRDGGSDRTAVPDPPARSSDWKPGQSLSPKELGTPTGNPA